MTKIKRLKIKLARKWQGLEVGEPLSRFGKGKFVDMVKLRGGRIKLVSHGPTPLRPKGTLILTPYWENHGFLVKFIDENGYSPWTKILNFHDIYQKLGGQAQVSDLPTERLKPSTGPSEAQESPKTTKGTV